MIDEAEFRNCIQLKEVKLCDGLEQIKEVAFEHCSSLLSVAIPSTVQVISGQASNDYSKLMEVILCEGLKDMRKFEFKDFISLERIRIPSTVLKASTSSQSMVVSSSLRCKLKCIIIPTTVKVIEQDGFKESHKLVQVELADGLWAGEFGVFFFQLCVIGAN